MPAAYTIPTALPFEKMGPAGNPFEATTPAQLGALYKSGQDAATAINQANYGNITTGYENVLAGQKAAQDAVHGNYGTLSADVLGDLDRAGSTRLREIADATTAAAGDIAQRTISSGAYNSTVQAGLERALLSDRLKAENDVLERVGGLKANYRSNIGLNALGFDERAARDNTGVGLNQLGMMERVSAPYPDARAYEAAASRMGAVKQQEADRAALNAAAGAGATAARQAGSVVPVMPGGGAGFFRDPNPGGSGGSGYSGEPITYGVPGATTRPRLGTVGSAAEGEAARAYFNSGLTSPYAGPDAGGFGGGFGSQGYGYDQPAGEDDAYGEPVPGLDVQPPGAGAFGRYGMPPSSGGGGFGAGGYDLGPGGETYRIGNYGEYYPNDPSADFYFGEG